VECPKIRQPNSVSICHEDTRRILNCRKSKMNYSMFMDSLSYPCSSLQHYYPILPVENDFYLRLLHAHMYPRCWKKKSLFVSNALWLGNSAVFSCHIGRSRACSLRFFVWTDYRLYQRDIQSTEHMNSSDR
jgi:hypothetical protein